jgi:transcriptional regulator with XRE-family HTH domain
MTAATQTLTATQCVMARNGLGLTVRQLAAMASLGKNTVLRLESGGSVGSATMRLLRETLEKSGAEFVGDFGVFIRKPPIRPAAASVHVGEACAA